MKRPCENGSWDSWSACEVRSRRPRGPAALFEEEKSQTRRGGELGATWGSASMKFIILFAHYSLTVQTNASKRDVTENRISYTIGKQLFEAKRRQRGRERRKMRRAGRRRWRRRRRRGRREEEARSERSRRSRTRRRRGEERQ